MKTFHQKIIRSKATNKKTNTRRILPIYIQETDPKINSKRIKAELLKFQIKLKQNGISAIHSTTSQIQHLTDF
jgi:hypothetical protein